MMSRLSHLCKGSTIVIGYVRPELSALADLVAHGIPVPNVTKTHWGNSFRMSQKHTGGSVHVGLELVLAVGCFLDVAVLKRVTRHTSRITHHPCAASPALPSMPLAAGTPSLTRQPLYRQLAQSPEGAQVTTNTW